MPFGPAILQFSSMLYSPFFRKAAGSGRHQLSDVGGRVSGFEISILQSLAIWLRREKEVQLDLCDCLCVDFRKFEELLIEDSRVILALIVFRTVLSADPRRSCVSRFALHCSSLRLQLLAV